MKKIPTLFERVFENGKVVGITETVTPGCEEAFLEGIPTIKIDGSCCAIIDGYLYKRYDAKNKKPPEGAIACSEPDPITGHWPHWVKVNPDDPADKWFVSACKNTEILFDGTYEAIGPHFNGNPYNYEFDILVRHGSHPIKNLERNYESIKQYLERNPVEGIVFWLDTEPICKIKRTDFGLPWPVK